LPPGSAWLSTGLAEMFGMELSAGGKLRIISAENVVRMERELSLSGSDSFSTESLARIRKNIGADIVLVGSYAALGGGPDAELRFDLRLQDTITGETQASTSRTGRQSDLLAMVIQSAAPIRQQLGIAPVTATNNQWRTSFSDNLAAQRLYSEGLAKLRQ
jgi:hypothetical protein